MARMAMTAPFIDGHTYRRKCEPPWDAVFRYEADGRKFIDLQTGVVLHAPRIDPAWFEEVVIVIDPKDGRPAFARVLV
jgi:hypothetical protein